MVCLRSLGVPFVSGERGLFGRRGNAFAWPDDEHRAVRSMRDSLAHTSERTNAVQAARADDDEVGMDGLVDQDGDRMAGDPLVDAR